MTTYNILSFSLATHARHSVCEIGIMEVRDGVASPVRTWLVRPMVEYFDDIMIYFHGINDDTVSDAPTFAELYPEIEPYLLAAPLVSHNSSFIKSVLRHACAAHDIDAPDINIFGCYQYSVANYNRLRHTFNDLCFFYLAKPDKLRRCANTIDCTFLIFRGMCAENVSGDISIFHKIAKTNPLANLTLDLQPDHAFYGQNICFTGTLQFFTRTEAQKKVTIIGGIAQKGLNKDTNILVVGTQDIKKVGLDGQSAKEEKAAKMLASGHKIQVIYEQDFMELL